MKITTLLKVVHYSNPITKLVLYEDSSVALSIESVQTKSC